MFYCVSRHMSKKLVIVYQIWQSDFDWIGLDPFRWKQIKEEVEDMWVKKMDGIELWERKCKREKENLIEKK